MGARNIRSRMWLELTPHEDKFPHGQWYVRRSYRAGKWEPMPRGWRPHGLVVLTYKVGKNYVYRNGSVWITYRPDKWANK